MEERKIVIIRLDRGTPTWSDTVIIRRSRGDLNELAKHIAIEQYVSNGGTLVSRARDGSARMTNVVEFDHSVGIGYITRYVWYIIEEE